MFWLVFDTARGPCVILQPASSLIFARIAASTAHKLDPKGFQEGHQLDAKLLKKIPKGLVGKRLTSKEAAGLLKRMGGH